MTTRFHPLSAAELRPSDYHAWRHLRQQLASREEAHRQQWRFRKNPAAYLAALEERLLQCGLPFLRMQAVEQFFAAIGGTIRHGGNMAFYSLANDFVQMSCIEAFRDA